MTRRYPLGPLLELTGWTMTDVRDLAPCGGEEYRLRVEHGVTERIADRLAIAAGLHPHVVWPEMADHAIADNQRACEECETRFLPKRSDQRFCSKECRWRKCNREGYRRRYQTDPAFREQQRQRVLAYQADERVAEVRRRKQRARDAERRKTA